MARKVDHSFVDTVDTRVRDTKRRTMAAVEVVNLRVSYQADVRRRESLRRERLAYEQESIETSQALARSEAYSRALETRIRVLETQAYRHEWQCQDADDRAIEHIIRTQALEAGARVDTLVGHLRKTMATVNQGMSVEEIEQIVAQRVANAIEAIAIYESINQTKQQENKVAENASNKRKWESDHNGSSNQQHKGHKVFWAHAVGPNNKKYAGSLPLCNKCKCHHNGPCTVKYGNWKKKYAGTLPLCTKCNYHHKGQCAPKILGHYKRDCPELKNQNHGNQAGSMEARGVVHAFGGGETKQDLNNIEDEIEA
ncbi:hypothetical protein Tco_0603543 [Tanacetum coccineum]